MARKTHLIAVAALVLVTIAAFWLPNPAAAQVSKINVVHYFSDTLGKAVITKIFDAFDKANPGFQIVDNTTGHEDFKTQILVMIAGDNPPDVFSYWAGARTQFVVDANRLMDLTQFWNDNKLDSIIPASVKNYAAMYNGKVYSIPMNVHIVVFWYNTKVMEKAGIKDMPKTWDDFLAACDKIKAMGVTPIALGPKNKWPAQYWFDYTVSRTAGPDYRQKLMVGQASYTDPEVAKALELWKSLVDKGYFVKDANAYDWTDAADQVASGKAAMTLMGTWITGYWNGLKPDAFKDYDFFAFPIIDSKVPEVVHGTVDGWAVPASAKNVDGAKKLLLHLLTPDSQATWALGQGTMASVNNVDPSIYSPVMKKASDYAGKVPLLGGYDLSTTPPMADGGLNMFAQFMNDPTGYKDYMTQAAAVAKDVFKK